MASPFRIRPLVTWKIKFNIQKAHFIVWYLSPTSKAHIDNGKGKEIMIAVLRDLTA
jgi:hypothetical protein